MADDIFLTPEEQDERARKWLKDNGPSIAIGIALGLGAIFAWQSWQTKQVKDAETASALYNQTLVAIQSSELSDISANVATLKQDHAGSPYAIKASLLRAKQLAVSDLDAASEELAWAVENATESGLVHTARIRQIKVLIARGLLDEASSLANQTDTAGFDSNYAELLGDIAVQQQEFATARQQYETAIDELMSQDLNYRAILTLKLNRLPFTEEAPSESDAAANNG